MCLKIEDKFMTRESARVFSKKPLVAKRDMYVYKFFIQDNDSFAYYDDDPMEINYDEYKGKIWYSPYRGAPYLPGGIHVDKKFSFAIEKVVSRWRLSVSKGIHSFRNKEIAENNYKITAASNDKFFTALVRCKIPKGTKYFKNGREIVSLKLEIPDYYWTPTNKTNSEFKISKGWELKF